MPAKNGGRREGAGRKPHAPDEKSRKFVETMAAVGIKEEHIASVVNVSGKTLRKHYRRELDTAAIKANAAVGQTWFNLATGGGRWQDANPAAMIWWTKVNMGAHEPKDPDATSVVNINVRGGLPEA